MTTQPTCKERINKALRGRIEDLEKLFRAYQEGEEERYSEDIGTFPGYGLSFDYVAPHTFPNQKRGYFRYQLSCGGPADEFRFYVDEWRKPTRIEYWFLDWFDGAKIILKGQAYDLLVEILAEILAFFEGVGTLQSEIEKSR